MAWTLQISKCCSSWIRWMSFGSPLHVVSWNVALRPGCLWSITSRAETMGAGSSGLPGSDDSISDKAMWKALHVNKETRLLFHTCVQSPCSLQALFSHNVAIDSWNPVQYHDGSNNHWCVIKTTITLSCY